MSSTGKAEAPSKYGVRGLDQEQKQAWDRLSRRPTVPTRYLKEHMLNYLGVEADVVKLSLVGEPEQGVHGFLFRAYPSFRRYTLEFLSSLRVIKRNVGRHELIDRVEFRLDNQNRVLTLADFDVVFKTAMDGDQENFNHDSFWKLITLEEHYTAGTSKASAIRNPVLRLCHRGISNSIFARSDSGSINSTEIFLLYSLLRGKLIHLNQYVPLYWERVARNNTGTICCGGHITAICSFFDIELNPNHIIPGEMYLTYDVLHQMDVLKRDQNCYAYLYQGSRGDHFPLPSPDLTHIDGWSFQANWKMDTSAHH